MGKKNTEILYIDNEKSKAIVSRGNSDRGYSFFESDLQKSASNKVDLSSVRAIDNIFDYIEDNNIDISQLQKEQITESVEKHEKTK